MRLIRQLLAESLLLALAGAGAALILTLWATDLTRFIPGGVTLDLTPDVRVVGFTLGLALLTGIAFGMAPALRSTRADLVSALKDGAPTAGSARSRLRNALVVTQLAVSLLLLIVGGLFVRSLRNMRLADPGFDTSGLAVAEFDLMGARIEGERARRFYDELFARLRLVPGVVSLSAASTVPLNGDGMRRSLTVPGYQLAPGEDGEVSVFDVAPDYFRTIGIAIVRGRPITDSDRAGAPRVAVVNETFARHYWPGQHAIGKRINLGGASGPATEVVGVAKDARYWSIQEQPKAHFYIPMLQAGYFGGAIHVRTTGDPALALRAIRTEAAALEPTAAVVQLRTLDKVRGDALLPSRLAAALLSAFGALALVLAALGLYGVMSYVVALRTREIGVRLALGAARRDVLRMVVGQGMRLALIGLGAGLVVAAAVTRVLASQLFGLGATDPATYAGLAGLLGMVALLASYLPARRAARVDPMVALRSE
ncbi:MAG: FtsX-like permease family protein [Gemmatimonadaceae bacterium]